MSQAEEKKRIRTGVVQFRVAEPPSMIEKSGKEWIYFGNDNLYPDYLVELYDNSPTHGAIVDSKVDYIVGLGLTGDPLMQGWIEQANPKESWNEIFRKITLDYEIHNAFYIEVIRDKVGRPVSFYHLDAARVRTNVDESIYFYSREWGRNRLTHHNHSEDHHGHSQHLSHNLNPTDITRFVPFDPLRQEAPTVKVDNKQEEVREIMVYKQYRPNLKWYALPPYMRSLTPIETESEIYNYDLNQWKFGFLGATMFNINNGEPENEEDKALMLRDLEIVFGGSGGKNIFVNFADNKDNAATIDGVKGENSSDEAKETDKRVMSAIFRGHRVINPELHGVKVPDGMGSDSDEKQKDAETFKKTYVANRQIVLLNFLEEIASSQGVEGELEVEELKIYEQDIPISELVGIFPTNILQQIAIDKFDLDIEVTEVPEVEPVEEAAFSKMTSEDSKILEALKKVGRSRKDFREIAGQEAKFNDGRMEFQDLEELDLFIIQALDMNPDYSATEISRLSKENDTPFSIIQIFKRLLILQGFGWILAKGARYLLSQLGKKERVQQIQLLPNIKLEIRYRYELRPDAPSLRKIGEIRSSGTLVTENGVTRQFCHDMLNAKGLKNKEWTKAEILDINNHLGTDVWMTRGGWLGVKNTDTALPFCRHWWTQVVVAA